MALLRFLQPLLVFIPEGRDWNVRYMDERESLEVGSCLGPSSVLFWMLFIASTVCGIPLGTGQLASVSSCKPLNL